MPLRTENRKFHACIHNTHIYATYMRTTLILNDEIALASKKLAAERRVSFSQIVNDALRREIDGARHGQTHKPFSMPIFGLHAQSKVDTTPAEFDQLLDDYNPQPS